MTKQTIQKHYTRILHLWPTDLLRPTVSFQSAIQHRIATRLNPPPASLTSPSGDTTHLPQPEDNVKANGAQVSLPSTAAAAKERETTFDESAELEQVNVLYSLLEDRYRKKYPLPDSMLRPTSQPTYYTDLIKELEAAPGRSWWQATVERWKGWLRWK